jgi:FtsP/CotA-like multicopper oxidase with cupredoxin domain
MRRLLCTLGATWFLTPPLAAQDGHPDIYSIELAPTPDLRGARGTVRLRWAPSPFGISVSPEGHHRFDLDFHLEGLPDPRTLGDYSTYVAWVTTPVLSPMTKLGEVGNGDSGPLGPVELNQFFVLVSAERDAGVATREGRLVLRGVSPSSRIQPDNHLMIPAGASPKGASGSMDHAHHGPDAGWPHPPMNPLIAMIPGLEDLRPNATPYLPQPAPDASVPLARPHEMLSLRDGDVLELVAGLVRRTIRGESYVMYGFNGQYPGPLIQVDQSSTITVRFVNETDHPTAVHWHGVRLENRYDGVPGVTQEPVLPGGSFEYRVFFRDAGIYWYHPHHREDIQQDLGLYGNMLVRAPDPDFFNEVHREEVLMLDDLLLGGQGLFPYGQERATHALMGRFGNVMLVNGEPEYRLAVKRFEVVRFFLTNVANTRTFHLSFGGARLKVVGSDLGKFEREEWAESLVIGPAERYIVEARFDSPGAHSLENRLQVLDHTFGGFFPETTKLGEISVAREEAPPLPHPFDALREHEDVRRDIAPYRSSFGRAVDRELWLTLETEGLPAKLVRRMRADSVYFNPVEWTETMPEMNFPTTGGPHGEVRWTLRDATTGKENLDIDWKFSLGEVVKLRLVNDRDALHAMQHPFHIHGQRFLVLSRNGAPNRNLVWKDTLLVATGETVDILLELSNPGRWMAHCHIAEHLETGMKLVFTVDTQEEKP